MRTPNAFDEANRMLAKANVLDYSATTGQLRKLRARAAELYDVGCAQGEHRACILALAHPTFGDGQMNRLRSSCRAGHQMSCRAVAAAMGFPRTPDGELALERSVGEWYGLEGVTLRCREATNRCNWALVREECSAGWPNSCHALSYRSGVVFRDRAYLLARQGCRAGILLECTILAASHSEEDQLFLATNECWLTGHCTHLGEHWLVRGELVKARDAFELACQTREVSCPALARRYLRGVLPEPVPHRGRDLLERYEWIDRLR